MSAELEVYQGERNSDDEETRNNAQRKIDIYFFGKSKKEERRSRMNKTDDPFRKWD